MQFTIHNQNPEEYKSDCLVFGIFEDQLPNSVKQLNDASNGYISNLIKTENLKWKIGQNLLLYKIPNIPSRWILLIGCGIRSKFNLESYEKVLKKSINYLKHTKSKEITLFLQELYDIKNHDNYWKIRKTIETFAEELYTFNVFKNKKEYNDQNILKKIILNIDLSLPYAKTNKLAMQEAISIASAIKRAKDLSNMPPNVCNSAYLAKKANQLSAKNKNITIQIITEEEMKKLKMNAYLAVGEGSKNESMMIIIKYDGKPKEIPKNPIVLIGKGLTFDSGGISIKPSNKMDEMKYDMCGAASVYGTMDSISKLNLPINVIGILAICENMISSKSYRPGDILKTMSGKTVEVINTDAEGRLVLCDVLTYAKRFNPTIVIDIATLTGACVVALGKQYNGLISNYDPLAKKILIAAKQSGDKTWRLPLDNKFQEQLKSNFADLSNEGGYMAGASTAGCFLEHFATKYQWAHLDIAGTAWNSGDKKGATGRPISLLTQFLLNHSKKVNFTKQ